MLARLRKALTRYVSTSLEHILRAAIIGILVGIIIGEALGFLLDSGWPEHPYVHIAAVLFGFLFAYAAAVTTALAAVIRGVIEVTASLENVAKLAANDGIGVVDAVVDALDGPNRHGIR
jgi:NhaP-type Na+/H+ or K+/H+ antiporter